MKYKVVRDAKPGARERFYIYGRRFFFFWQYLAYFPSHALCRRWLLEHGCTEYVMENKEWGSQSQNTRS